MSYDIFKKKLKWGQLNQNIIFQNPKFRFFSLYTSKNNCIYIYIYKTYFLNNPSSRENYVIDLTLNPL